MMITKASGVGSTRRITPRPRGSRASQSRAPFTVLQGLVSGGPFWQGLSQSVGRRLPSAARPSASTARTARASSTRAMCSGPDRSSSPAGAPRPARTRRGTPGPAARRRPPIRGPARPPAGTSASSLSTALSRGPSSTRAGTSRPHAQLARPAPYGHRPDEARIGRRTRGCPTSAGGRCHAPPLGTAGDLGPGDLLDERSRHGHRDLQEPARPTLTSATPGNGRTRAAMRAPGSRARSAAGET